MSALITSLWPHRFVAAAVCFSALLVSPELAQAQFMQQGPKLVGTDAVGSGQGDKVAVSADGNTAIVGGLLDNSYAGAAWVFTRSGGVWTQQGSKLVGTGAVAQAQQGYSVALSGDGNTAIVGGPSINGVNGAAWVFIRSGGVWTQQGSKLVGTGAVGAAAQGTSVALSGDGNTAIVSGGADNSSTGAVWVFTRSNGVWEPRARRGRVSQLVRRDQPSPQQSLLVCRLRSHSKGPRIYIAMSTDTTSRPRRRTAAPPPST
jgi:hypothetical protein